MHGTVDTRHRTASCPRCGASKFALVASPRNINSLQAAVHQTCRAKQTPFTVNKDCRMDATVPAGELPQTPPVGHVTKRVCSDNRRNFCCPTGSDAPFNGSATIDGSADATFLIRKKARPNLVPEMCLSTSAAVNFYLSGKKL